MEIVFFSNFLNHHQLPFCLELIKAVGEDNFIFVASEQTNPVCLSLGYEEMNSKYPFVLRAYEDNDARIQAQKLAETADIAIIGGGSEKYKQIRMRHNLHTFCFIERLLKESTFNILNPRVFLEIFRRFTKYRFKNLYVMCASAYAADDLFLAGFPKSKCYKWGYFPDVNIFDIKENLLQKKEDSNRISISWVARMIDWKHPEKPVLLAKLLKEKGYNFEINMLGEGGLEANIRQLINETEVEDCVFLRGVKPYKEVRNYMKKSNIFIFTSDRNEGWGAVLNEAMNSGCAVVADKHIGSAPFLVHDGVNGFLYDGSVDDLYNKVSKLIDDTLLREQYASAAYSTMINVWNAEKASQRFLSLASNLITGSNNKIDIGPCSLV